MKYQKTKKSKKSNKKLNKSKTIKKVNKRTLKTRKIGGNRLIEQFTQLFQKYYSIVILDNPDENYDKVTVYIDNYTDAVNNQLTVQPKYGDVCLKIKKGRLRDSIFPESFEYNNITYFFSPSKSKENSIPIYSTEPNIPNKLFKNGVLIAKRKTYIKYNSNPVLTRLWPVKIKTIDQTAKLFLYGFDETNQPKTIQPIYRPYKILKNNQYYPVKYQDEYESSYTQTNSKHQKCTGDNSSIETITSMFCQSYKFKDDVNQLNSSGIQPNIIYGINLNENAIVTQESLNKIKEILASQVLNNNNRTALELRADNIDKKLKIIEIFEFVDELTKGTDKPSDFKKKFIENNLYKDNNTIKEYIIAAINIIGQIIGTTIGKTKSKLSNNLNSINNDFKKKINQNSTFEALYEIFLRLKEIKNQKNQKNQKVNKLKLVTLLSKQPITIELINGYLEYYKNKEEMNNEEILKVLIYIKNLLIEIPDLNGLTYEEFLNTIEDPEILNVLLLSNGPKKSSPKNLGPDYLQILKNNTTPTEKPV
jgi:hypothetical protein